MSKPAARHPEWSYVRSGYGSKNADFDIVSSIGGARIASTPYENHARAIASLPKLLAALHECAEYLEQEEDVVDGSYGIPAPNKAMVLLREVREAIATATAP